MMINCPVAVERGCVDNCLAALCYEAGVLLLAVAVTPILVFVLPVAMSGRRTGLRSTTLA